MSILPQSFFTLVRRHFMTFALFTAGHIATSFFYDSIKTFSFIPLATIALKSFDILKAGT
jgi:hypothetical protein